MNLQFECQLTGQEMDAIGYEIVSATETFEVPTLGCQTNCLLCVLCELPRALIICDEPS